MKRPFDMALRAIPIMAMFAGERLATCMMPVASFARFVKAAR